MKKYFFSFLLVITALMACKKVINVDLNNADAQIVIEGIVNNISPAKVTITKSVKFSDSNTFPAVNGATVIITDNLNNQYTLASISNGVYQNNSLMGVPGRTYNLSVIAESKTYTASSTMPFQVNLDTLLIENIAFGNKYINVVKPQFTDPLVYQNYYQFIETINGKVYPGIFTWDDRLINGGVSTRPLLQGDSTIVTGDIVKVEMRCIDKNIYSYVRGLQDLQSGQTTPANPTTNIIGGALGYFSAHTSQTKQVKVP
jgi:hypothetical protein